MPFISNSISDVAIVFLMFLLVKSGDVAYPFIVFPIKKKRGWGTEGRERFFLLPVVFIIVSISVCLQLNSGLITLPQSVKSDAYHKTLGSSQHKQCPRCQQRQTFKQQKFFCKDWYAFEGLHAKDTLHIRFDLEPVIQISGDLNHRILFCWFPLCAYLTCIFSFLFVFPYLSFFLSPFYVIFLGHNKKCSSPI